jgi:hypothetical protein
MGFAARRSSANALQLSCNFLPTFDVILAYKDVKEVKQSRTSRLGTLVVDLRLRAPVSRGEGRECLLSHETPLKKENIGLSFEPSKSRPL